MQQIVLASGNKGKLAEFEQMLSAYGVTVLPQNHFNVGEVAETGTTFVENAIIKARHAAQVTGLAAIADDSGLEVDLLQGAPGIYSARYAGDKANDQDNVLKLLDALKDYPAPRSARFQCVLVYMRHGADPSPLICQASWEGQIAFEQRGTHGHGYDPIFIPEHQKLSAAELSSDEKNALSHRGKALAQLLAMMQAKGVFTGGNSQ